MKKFLSIILSVVITTMSSAVAFGADTLSMEWVSSSSSISVGDTFYVDCVVRDNPTGYNSLTGYINYDPSVIRAVECDVADIPDDLIIRRNEDGAALSLFSYTNVNSRVTFVPKEGDTDYNGMADGVKTASEIGRIKLSNYLGSSQDNMLLNYEGTGTLLRLKFEAIAQGTTTINLSDCIAAYFNQGNSNMLDYTLNDIEINVAEAVVTKGDVNNDGQIDYRDSILVLRYSAGTSELTVNQQTAADVNNDGRIDYMDSILILRYAAGSITGF